MEIKEEGVEHIEVDYTHLCPPHPIQDVVDFLYIRGGLEYWYPQVKDLEAKDKILLVFIEENFMPRRFTRKHLIRRLFARLPKHLVKRLKERVFITLVGEILDRMVFEERMLYQILNEMHQYTPWVAPSGTKFNPFLINAISKIE